MSNLDPLRTTFLAVMTPEGRGAIGVIRVWGPGALAAADRVFRPARGRPLAQTPAGRPRFGRVGGGLGDEVVAVIIGLDPPEVEIQCHGGPAAVAMIVDALRDAGVEQRRPVAWVRHAAGSAIEAEAVVDLARAQTARVAEILLDQEAGALRRELERLQGLIDARSVEAGRRLQRLAAAGRVGLKAVGGWSVVLTGRPNVGKSSLLNALAGFDRSIIAATPGTTRDVVTQGTAFDGWPVDLSDTAGLRASAADAIEDEGVRRARSRRDLADLAVLIFDGSEPLTDEDHGLHAESPAALVVASKADRPAAWGHTALDAIRVSAHSGEGLETLIAAVATRLVPEPPEPGQAVPFRPRHVRAVNEARDALDRGEHGSARDALGRLLGPLRGR